MALTVPNSFGILRALPNFPGDGPVEAHFVDFAVAVDVIWRIGIRNEKRLVCALRHAQRLRIAHVGECGFEDAVVVKNLDALVAASPGRSCKGWLGRWIPVKLA